MSSFVLFSGTSHPKLAQEVAKQLGVSLGASTITRFPDEEINLVLNEEVRGKKVFILQSCVGTPQDYLMELFLLIDAAKRAGAAQIIPILPYFAYCRQDRINQPGQPISARLVANLLERSGATQVIAVDLHAGQLEGFFNIPVLHLTAAHLIAHYLKSKTFRAPIVVAPDVGSIRTARKVAKDLGCDFAVIDKHRKEGGELEARLIGDVKGKEVIFADDICTTGRTLEAASNFCKEKGAHHQLACFTHALLVKDAIKSLEKCALDELVFTNSVPSAALYAVHAPKKGDRDSLTTERKYSILSLASLLADAVRSI